MSVLRITGGKVLHGTVAASGSKNAALPMMAASILAAGPVRLQDVPRLSDVDTLRQVLGELGVETERPADDQLLLRTVDPTPVRARYDLVRRMRASFCVLGPLLARRGKAVVALPGGCNIGDRPVDLHLGGLQALGAQFRLEQGYVVARARRLVGTTIHLGGPHGSTVTGTANVLCAAVLARGETVITGAAMEPEIADLGSLLCAMGAKIAGLGTATLRIDGVSELGGATHRVIPDRIEAVTLLVAAAITGGSATVAGIVPEHLTEVLDALERAGLRIEVAGDRVSIAAAGRPRPIDVHAEPYPGIPTDVQAQWTALMCLARGRSTVRDGVFPARFMHIAELNRLGARIQRRNSAAVVTGVKRFTGARVTAFDLRASAALVLAGLAARGETTIRQAHHLDRGYEQLDDKLNRLGAEIRRSEKASNAIPRPAETPTIHSP